MKEEVVAFDIVGPKGLNRVEGMVIRKEEHDLHGIMYHVKTFSGRVIKLRKQEIKTVRFI